MIFPLLVLDALLIVSTTLVTAILHHITIECTWWHGEKLKMHVNLGSDWLGLNKWELGC